MAKADDRQAAEILRRIIPEFAAMGLSPTQAAYLHGVADALDRPTQREALRSASCVR
jgi:hypothetical protein